MGYTILIVGTTPGDKGNQTCPSGITSSIPTYQLAGGHVQSKFDLSSLCLERQGDIRQAEMRRRDPDRSVPTGSQVPPHSLEHIHVYAVEKGKVSLSQFAVFQPRGRSLLREGLP